MAYWHDKDTGDPARPFAPNSYFDGSHLMPLILVALVCLALWLKGGR